MSNIIWQFVPDVWDRMRSIKYSTLGPEVGFYKQTMYRSIRKSVCQHFIDKYFAQTMKTCHMTF